jgi:hypothetical protein
MGVLTAFSTGRWKTTPRDVPQVERLADHHRTPAADLSTDFFSGKSMFGDRGVLDTILIRQSKGRDGE